jgi:hypothetical protein
VLEDAAKIEVRNPQGKTLATALLHPQAAADVARVAFANARSASGIDAREVVKLRRAPGVIGKLSAWVCPTPVSGNAPPPKCTAKAVLARAATLKLPTSMRGKLRIVIVRH